MLHRTVDELDNNDNIRRRRRFIALSGPNGDIDTIRSIFLTTLSDKPGEITTYCSNLYTLHVF